MTQVVRMINAEPNAVTTQYILRTRYKQVRISPFMEWWHDWPRPFRISKRKPQGRLYCGQIELRQHVAKRSDIKAWLKEYKSILVCVDCHRHDIRLEFHHLHPRDKRYWIKDMITGLFTIEEIKVELSKCIPLCRTCHNIRTREIRKQGLSNRATTIRIEYLDPAYIIKYRIDNRISHGIPMDSP